MARDFSGSGQYLIFSGTPPVTTEPLTLSCQFNPDDTGIRKGLLYIRQQGATQWWGIGRTSGDQIEAHQRGSVFNQATSGGTVSQDTWHVATGVFAGDADRRAFLDGGNKGTNTTDIVTSGVDRIYVGARDAGTQEFNGQVAEAGIWDAALTDDEVAQLGLFVSPLLVRPQNLVWYAPVLGRHSPEIDIVGGFDLTVTDATVADHPRVFYPAHSRLAFGAAAAPPSEVGPANQLGGTYLSQPSKRKIEVIAY